jgi:hypothetical protein
MAETMAQRSLDKEFSSLRILIANVPADLEEWLVQEVQDQEDIEIVGQICGYMNILIAAQEDVDVVVMSVEELQPPPGICSHLLAEFPNMKILLLSPLRDKAMLYWMGLHQKDLQSVSSEAILETLRQLDTFTDL